MRFAFILAACALAAPALAQPGAQTPAQPAAAAQQARAGQPQATAPAHNPEADAALTMSIRLREEAEQRIARIACAAGDAAKCAVLQPAKASAAAPVP